MSPARRKGVTVSVALCTHNGARFVGEQLRSILEQSRRPDQLVVSDDASTDDTLAVVESTLAQYRQTTASGLEVILLRNAKALGVAANFEQAIASTTGSLIALSDQDDRWVPDRIERAVALFEERVDLLLVHGDAELVDELGSPLGATLFEALGVGPDFVRTIHDGGAMSLLLKRNLVTGATTMIRRELFDVARPIPAGWLHDEWLAVVAAATGGVDVLERRLIDYRQHDSNEVGITRLGFGGKVRRMRAPGAARNERLLVRARSFAARFDQLAGVPETYRSAVHRKLAHEEARSALGPNRLVRWPRVLRELGTGRYSEFGRGVSDAVRDLIQPLGTSR